MNFKLNLMIITKKNFYLHCDLRNLKIPPTAQNIGEVATFASTDNVENKAEFGLT